jgi:erythromycin esterase
MRDAATLTSLTTEQVKWLAKNIVPIRTILPDSKVYDKPDSIFSDLLPLKQFIGKAHIVGLGEAEYGAHEFPLMNHRLFEFLVREMGFTVIAIDVNMPEGDKINNFVLHGVGDPAELVRSIPYWPWNGSQEMVDMIKWIRDYNASGQKPAPIEFRGFGMHYMQAASDSIKRFLYKVDPIYAKKCDTIYDRIIAYQKQANTDYRENHLHPETRVNEDHRHANFPLMQKLAKDVMLNLEKKKTSYIKKSSASESRLMIQYAAIVQQALKEQFLLDSSSALGSKFLNNSMADNFKWIRQQYPRSKKIAIWANNVFISRMDERMGTYLSQSFGSDYLPIGSLYYQGKYSREINDGKFSSFPIDPAPSGTCEWLFYGLGISPFLLDLRKALPNDQASTWLTNTISYHENAIYGTTMKVANLKKEYDAIMFIDNFGPSKAITNK